MAGGHQVTIDDGGFVRASATYPAMTKELAAAVTAEMLAAGRQQELNAYLLDVRGSSSGSSDLAKYDFAYSQTADLSIPRTSRTALLHSPGDSSYAFLETVMVNAGFLFQMFDSEPAAIAWLQESTPE